MIFAGSASAQVLYTEGFEGLTMLDSALASDGVDETDFSEDLPTGWVADNGATPPPTTAGTEYFGFSVLDKQFWINQAGNQDRSSFARGTNSVLVADPDQYDDAVDVDPDRFNVFAQTPAISLTGVPANTVTINFDSSFRPYDGMTGLVGVSYDGGTTFSELLRLDSTTSGGNSSLSRANEAVTLSANNPAGGSMIVRFGMIDGGNDWWWAVDNLSVVQGDPSASITVNRDTGEITMRNGTASSLNLAGYSITSRAGALSAANWTPVTGRLDAPSNGGNGSLDNGKWTKLTLPEQSDNLSEASLDAADDAAGGTLAIGRTIDLSNQGSGPANGGWLRSPVEDLAFQYISGGRVVDGLVRYVGTPLLRGDFNADGTIDAADWAISRDNQRFVDASISSVEAYQRGDLTGDLRNNHADFVAFKQLYDAQNGAGSFMAMLDSQAASVPEPSTTTLLLIGTACFALTLRKSKDNQ